MLILASSESGSQGKRTALPIDFLPGESTREGKSAYIRYRALKSARETMIHTRVRAAPIIGCSSSCATGSELLTAGMAVCPQIDQIGLICTFSGGLDWNTV